MIKCRNCGKENPPLAFQCKKCGKMLKHDNGIMDNALLFAALAIDVASNIAGAVMENVMPDDCEVCDTCEDVEVKTSEKASCTDEDDSKSKSEEQIYVASSTAGKFHKPDCR